MKNNQNNLKWIVMAGFLMVILVTLVFNLYSDYQNKIAIENTPENLKLKAPKERIASYVEYPSSDGKEVIIQYIYGTDTKAPAQIHQGFKEDLSKRTPTSQSFLKEVRRIDDEKIEEDYIGKFYSGTNFYQDENSQWYQAESATTTKTSFLIQTKSSLVDRARGLLGQPVFAATDVTYSGAGDGTVWTTGRSTWDDAHNDVTGDGSDYSGTYQLVGGGKSLFGSTFFIYRYFIPFDTSGLDDTAVISSASLYLMQTVFLINGINDGNDFLTVVQATQASNTSLSNADYDQAGATHGAIEGIDSIDRIDFGSLIVDTYFSFPLNPTGISWISKTGYTKLGIREGHDILDITITANVNDAYLTTSEQTGTTKDPYLEITYTVGSDSKIKIGNGKIKIGNGKIKID